MRRLVAVLFFALIGLPSIPALAEPIPEYVLDHDYVSCMGGITPQKDPERASYCACIQLR